MRSLLCFGDLLDFCLSFADPLSMSPQKALELVGNNLQKQYERWQPRARYKQLLDPTTEEVRKLCLALRKNARVSSMICSVSKLIILFI